MVMMKKQRGFSLPNTAILSLKTADYGPTGGDSVVIPSRQAGYPRQPIIRQYLVSLSPQPLSCGFKTTPEDESDFWSNQQQRDFISSQFILSY